MKNIISISVISILILSGLSACKVKVAEAPKLGVEAPVALKTFAAQDLSFQDVKIFLWKKNTSPKDVETVLRSSKRMDKLAEDLAMINEAKARGTAIIAICHDTAVRDAIADRLFALTPLQDAA